MTAVVRATQIGDDRRIGPVSTHDEIGELARQFDLMLDELARRNQELKRATATLEVKVSERTWELEAKNTDLEMTIRLLQQTREQLLMAEKLSAVGVLSAGVAHEINNPLAVIQGNLEVLAAELGDDAKPIEREIELIARQVDRIRHIVTSLLQFARPGDNMAEIMEVDVNRAVGDVLPLVGYVFKKKAIVLHTRLGASGVIRINLYELEQVLINLLINAANAVTSGGRVEVETSDCDSDGVVIRVRDNGAGIPAALLTRVFDPFFTTDLRHGTGLGLSVSYGIIRRYGGDISVESAVGKGSVFQLLLRREPSVVCTVTAQTAGHSVDRDTRTPLETTEANHERRDKVG
jgi:two-component system NtrC family sensor kinase